MPVPIAWNKKNQWHRSTMRLQRLELNNGNSYLSRQSQCSWGRGKSNIRRRQKRDQHFTFLLLWLLFVIGITLSNLYLALYDLCCVELMCHQKKKPTGTKISERLSCEYTIFDGSVWTVHTCIHACINRIQSKSEHRYIDNMTILSWSIVKDLMTNDWNRRSVCGRVRTG